MRLQASYGQVVDALFGFSFTPPVRPAFAGVLDTLRRLRVPVCSVDVPSGKQTYTHTNKQRAIQTNTQTDRQTDNVNKVTIPMFSEDVPLGKQYITQTYTHKNQQMNTQMNKHTEKQIHSKINTQMDKYYKYLYKQTDHPHA